jgi:hypothetical protein
MSEVAWVRIPSEQEIRAAMPKDAPRHPYDFGFLPAMLRLVRAHGRIGRALGGLFAEVMFGAGALTRDEREMVAAIAAAAQDCAY